MLKMKKLAIVLCGLVILNCSADEPLLLITGCGRSGTSYIAAALTLGGLEIGHEWLHKDGAVSWLAVGDDQEVWPRVMTNHLKYQHIFQQVRHPLDVISSWYYNDDIIHPSLWDFIYKNAPQISASESLLVRCAKYWYYWNQLAEKKAEWTYRIEDIEEVIPEMERRLGVTLDHQTMKIVSKQSNHWHSIDKRITWADLKKGLTKQDYDNIVNLAKKYGYSTES